MRNARVAALLVSGGICSATQALAQTPSPSEAATQPAPAAATQPAPAAATQPAPAAAENEDKLFRFYGTFTPRLVIATSAVESFSQPNEVAISAAGNPVIAPSPDKDRYSFQVAQTRVGFWLNEKGAVRAQLEIDFVDFTKATPTVASLPRLRIARVDYSFSPGHTLSLGQDWDLHAPLNPHGINLVGALFQAGNTGFMRQQFKYLYSNSNMELGAAVGFPAPNNTAKDTPLEIGSLPTLAVRGAYKFGKSRVGVTAIATRLPFNLGAPDERHGNAYAVALFSELSPSADTTVRVELNYGQNTANLGMLSLAQGRASDDLRDLGGFISVRQVVTGPHAVYGMAGYQKVTEPSKVVPSYGYASLPTDGSPPAFSSAALTGTGPGILHNGAVRLGYEFKPTKLLAFVLEGFLYQTRFRLQAVDEGRANAERTSLGLETGAVLTF
ncbi:hypothetical protein [Vitiosangium sp. GDMCC 1.1324]|uniref:hypothetical protein n=1 Tax=Vitiosangium sp. (strain GDMCC 1.1324) TaxID=2138576 RepID=UPI000D3BAD3F|nr:hypothetical protein [Vitiosangium sp. GDMCC 1.1324]PTL76094.1 hypothetical protein DAT35_50895 [Vitiosangium sp. GDMCC 1.1324]